MIHHVKGNLLESDADALVNTVNCVGVMGKGIALQFKKKFPKNFELYKEACSKNEVRIGKMFITEENANLFTDKKIIINFPTKTHWKYPSEYSYIINGLDTLKIEIVQRNIKSIAIPALGCTNGKLVYNKVHKMILDKLQDLECEIYLYEPLN